MAFLYTRILTLAQADNKREFLTVGQVLAETTDGTVATVHHYASVDARTRGREKQSSRRNGKPELVERLKAFGFASARESVRRFPNGCTWTPKRSILPQPA
jgi:hypothetical protein